MAPGIPVSSIKSMVKSIFILSKKKIKKIESAHSDELCPFLRVRTKICNLKISKTVTGNLNMASSFRMMSKIAGRTAS